jgi:ubiquitin carboxyl-terminal hydrolase 8
VLSNGDWVKQYRVGKKPDEKIPNPQIMTKIVANLFNWMQTGKFPKMRAKTLMVRCRTPPKYTPPQLMMALC